jgi:DNA-binding transcriptional LysR family regulator
VIREPLVLALQERHELALGRTLALERALDQPLVIFPRRTLPSLYDAVFAMYHAAGRTPQVAQEAIQMLTIVNFVSAGLGVAWVPETVCQLQRTGIRYRQIAGKQAQQVPRVDTSLVWQSTGNPILERFIEFARAHVPDAMGR